MSRYSADREEEKTPTYFVIVKIVLTLFIIAVGIFGFWVINHQMYADNETVPQPIIDASRFPGSADMQLQEAYIECPKTGCTITLDPGEYQIANPI